MNRNGSRYFWNHSEVLLLFNRVQGLPTPSVVPCWSSELRYGFDPHHDACPWAWRNGPCDCTACHAGSVSLDAVGNHLESHEGMCTEVFEEISQNRGFTRERWSVVNRRFHRRHDHILIAGQHELEPPGTLTAEHARLLYFCNIGSSECCVLVALCAWGD